MVRILKSDVKQYPWRSKESGTAYSVRLLTLGTSIGPLGGFK